MDKESMVYIHTVKFYSALKKRGKFFTCYNMAEPWVNYRWYKLVIKTRSLWFYLLKNSKVAKWIWELKVDDWLVRGSKELEMSWWSMGIGFSFEKWKSSGKSVL